MRLFIVAVDEPIYMNPYVAGLIDAKVADVVGVASYHPAPQATRRHARRLLTLALLAAVSFSPRNLGRLVWWRMMAGFGRRPGGSLEDLCARRGVPFTRVCSVNAPEFVERLRSLDIDVLLHQTPEILRSDALKAPRLGVINRHLALLPAYRGAWPVFWQFVNDERRFGITIHKVDEGIDTGGVLAQASIDRIAGDTIAAVHERLFAHAVPLTCEALERLARGEAGPPSAAAGVCYRTPAPLKIISYMLGRRRPSSPLTA